MRRIPEFELTKDQRLALERTRDWAGDFFKRQELAVLHRMGGHGFDKSERTAAWAAMIASGECYSTFLPVLTALLIDVGRTSTDPRATTYGHGQLSREMSAGFLASLPILTAEDRILVGDAIEDHPLLNENVRPTWLVKVVMDADRMDCLGPLGPLRAASGLWPLPLVLADQLKNETTWAGTRSMYDGMRFQLAWYALLWTKTAREIARPRVIAYRSFVARVAEEALFTNRVYQRLFET